MKKPFLNLSRKRLPTTYKSLVRHKLDYADIIYDKPVKRIFQRDDLNGFVQCSHYNNLCNQSVFSM